MASNEELERRVAALEAEMADVRTLAAGADADVSRFDAAMRGQTRLLNALRETQAEHSQRLDRIDSRLDRVDSRFDAVDGRLDAMDGRLDAMDGRLDAMDGRLGAMDGRFDRMDGGIEAILRILNARFLGGPAPA